MSCCARMPRWDSRTNNMKDVVRGGLGANGCLRYRLTPVCASILFREQQTLVTWSRTVLAIEKLQSIFFDAKLEIVFWKSLFSLDTTMGLLWVLGNCEAKWGQVSELMVTWYNCNWVFGTGNVVIGRKTNVRDGTFSESRLGKLFVFEVMKLWSCEGFGCEQLCDSEVWRVSIAMNVWHLLMKFWIWQS